MAMETALLNLNVAEVLGLLKKMLNRQGYVIEKIDLKNTVLLAYKEGKWFRHPQHITFQISSIDETFTRVDVTAKIEATKTSREEEEIIEEKLVMSMYKFFQ